MERSAKGWPSETGPSPLYTKESVRVKRAALIDLKARGRYECHRQRDNYKQGALQDLPFYALCDSKGRIFEHPRFRMAGFSGNALPLWKKRISFPCPNSASFFFIPDCPPVGMDPETGQYRTVTKVKVHGATERCYGVAAFLEPGLVRSHLPAADYRPKAYLLPMWAYTAVGFREGRYWAAGFRIEYNPKWDPRHYDDRKLLSAMRSYRKSMGKVRF